VEEVSGWPRRLPLLQAHPRRRLLIRILSTHGSLQSTDFARLACTAPRFSARTVAYPSARYTCTIGKTSIVVLLRAKKDWRSKEKKERKEKSKPRPKPKPAPDGSGPVHGTGPVQGSGPVHGRGPVQAWVLKLHSLSSLSGAPAVARADGGGRDRGRCTAAHSSMARIKVVLEPQPQPEPELETRSRPKRKSKSKASVCYYT
jgi:hypothetical protein